MTSDPSDGFFWCGRCKHVVEPSESQLVGWENAVQGVLAKLKCPRCHRWEVIYRLPKVQQTRPIWRARKLVQINAPVTDERAAAGFFEMRKMIEST